MQLDVVAEQRFIAGLAVREGVPDVDDAAAAQIVDHHLGMRVEQGGDRLGDRAVDGEDVLHARYLRADWTICQCRQIVTIMRRLDYFVEIIFNE